jgi:hypothetical protein
LAGHGTADELAWCDDLHLAIEIAELGFALEPKISFKSIHGDF